MFKKSSGRVLKKTFAIHGYGLFFRSQEKTAYNKGYTLRPFGLRAALHSAAPNVV
jgi:hypothetical protein